MTYYECYHISKSYNFNTKLNYIFNNMKHQALVTLVMVCVTMIAPNLTIILRGKNQHFTHVYYIIKVHYFFMGYDINVTSI